MSDAAVPALLRFDVILAEDFVLTELSAVVDVIRLANRVSLRPMFEWRYLSLAGGVMTSSAGASVVTETCQSRPNAHYAFFLGNLDPEHPALSQSREINAYTNRGTKVFLLAEAASRYIQELDGEGPDHTTHWENRAILEEKLGGIGGPAILAHDSGKVVTCAGMGSTVDVMLAVIGAHLTSATVMTVADILLHDKIREHETMQPFGGASLGPTGDDDLDRCIALMQSHVEEPLSIQDLGHRLSISNRTLERKFRTHLNATPNGYYRELRLNKASNLLLNSSLPISEIALVCGFSSGFSSLYKELFGLTPAALRRRKAMQQGRGEKTNAK